MLVFTGVNVLTMNFGMLEPPQKDSSNIFFLVQALCLRDGINLWQFNLLILYPKTSTISPLPLKLKLPGCYTTRPAQPTNLPTNLPTYQPTNQRTSQPTNQPTPQLPQMPSHIFGFRDQIWLKSWHNEIPKPRIHRGQTSEKLKENTKTPRGKLWLKCLIRFILELKL